MTIEKITNNIICDTIGCNTLSTYVITTNSYKGNIILCTQCFKKLQNITKRIKDNNELSK